MIEAIFQKAGHHEGIALTSAAANSAASIKSPAANIAWSVG
jgi:hypothetical protein